MIKIPDGRKYSRRDRECMKRALTLARRGLGKTSPNPVVGAVLASRKGIVAEGYHRRRGEAHAEVVALERAGRSARGATLYVTLEPCSHHGYTPPCADALIRAGVKKIYAAMQDPNPAVAGRGLRRLRSAGIEVDIGLSKDQAARLNEQYSKFIVTGRPWVTLKAAVTLDGKIATRSRDSRWISSIPSRKKVRTLRFLHDAVMVGAGTVIRDDPGLNVERKGKRRWYKIILDPGLLTPPASRLFDAPADTQVLIFALEKNKGKAAGLHERGARIEFVDGRADSLNLASVLDVMGRLEIASVLVEGGSAIFTSFIQAGLADKAVFFVAPKLLGNNGLPVVAFPGPDRMKDVVTLRDIRISKLGPDAVVEGYL